MLQPVCKRKLCYDTRIHCTVLFVLETVACGFFGYRDQSCGTLFCSGGWEFPVTSRKSIYKVGNGDMCNMASMNPEDNYPEDLGMVPTGTKCGNNMVRKRKA